MNRPVPEPDCCECRNNMTPSPFHCGCGRWKPSAQEQCDWCAVGLVPPVVIPTRKYRPRFKPVNVDQIEAAADLAHFWEVA